MVFIEGNVPSSKNSKINGKFFSKTVQKYLRSFGIKSFSSRKKDVETYKTIPMTFPVEKLKKEFKGKGKQHVVLFHFVRDSKHKFDFGNVTQIILDLLTAFDIIEDDNMDYIIPMPWAVGGKWYSYNKENPGLYLIVENADLRL